VEKRKEATGESVIVKNQKKKLEREEEKLKTNTRDLSLVKMKSMFAIGVAFTALLSIFNSMLANNYTCDEQGNNIYLFLIKCLLYFNCQFRRPSCCKAAIHSIRLSSGNFSPKSARHGLHGLLVHFPVHFVYHGNQTGK